MTASRVVLCKNTVAEGSLCDVCLARPLDGKYQDRLLHGLLTEPIPENSRIYGGPWYWEQVYKNFEGDPSLLGHAKEWLMAAIESQRLAEEFCGPGAWKVQRLSAREVQMRRASAKKAKAPSVQAPTKEKVQGTVLAAFSPIKIIYEESIAEPVKLPTDSMKIRKETYGDIAVWITESGLVFDCDTTGDPSELIARYVDGDFIAF